MQHSRDGLPGISAANFNYDQLKTSCSLEKNVRSVAKGRGIGQSDKDYERGSSYCPSTTLKAF